MLGVAFYDTLPISRADHSIDLTMNLLHQIVFISLVVKTITVACFAGEDVFSAWVKTIVTQFLHRLTKTALNRHFCALSDRR